LFVANRVRVIDLSVRRAIDLRVRVIDLSVRRAIDLRVTASVHDARVIDLRATASVHDARVIDLRATAKSLARDQGLPAAEVLAPADLVQVDLAAEVPAPEALAVAARVLVVVAAVAASILDKYDCLLADLDGVVYEGSLAIDGAVDAINRAQASGLKVGYVTNNSSRKPETIADQLNNFGLKALPVEIVSVFFLSTAELGLF
jgi:phosphoglycolate phosphatase-like HAD superfamily hydrolase